MKRIASIQDISCLGRCSLTVALPVISAMGVECAIVPTAEITGGPSRCILTRSIPVTSPPRPRCSR